MRQFIGEGHHQVLKLLLSRVEDIAAGDSDLPSVILVEGPSGIGKSRVIRELYRELCGRWDKQGYWPELQETGGGESTSRDPLPGRKSIGPETCGWPAGALPGFGWWPLRCDRMQSGQVIDVVAQARPELEAHLVPMALAWKRAATPNQKLKAHKETLATEARKALADGGLEAASYALDQLGFVIPGLGTAASWIFRGAKAMQGHWTIHNELSRNVDLSHEASDRRRTVSADIATMIAGVSHRLLPGVVVVEDLHLMGPELAHLLDQLAVRRPEQAVVVIGMAWPEHRDDSPYAKWRARALDAAEAQLVTIPDLAIEDLQRIVMTYAPNTAATVAQAAAERYPNPLTLEATLSSPLVSLTIDAAGGALPLEALDSRPVEIDDVYRDRFRQLSDEVQLALAVTAGCLPYADSAHIWPFIRGVVVEAVAHCSGLPSDAGEVLTGIEYAANAKVWLMPSGVADTFREALQAHIAYEHLERKVLLPQGRLSLREAVSEVIARRIRESCSETSFLNSTDESSILARWLLDLCSTTRIHDKEMLVAAAFRVACDLADAYQYNSAIDTLSQYFPLESSERPDYLTIRHNLASWLGEAGSVDAAVNAFTQLLDDLVKIQGPHHPDTLSTKNNLAYWLGQSGRTKAAMATYEQVVVDRLRVLGADHPDTLISRGNLASRLSDAGQPAEAITSLHDVLADQIRILGPNHPNALSTRHNLASSLGQAGLTDDAITAYRGLVADRLRILGDDHPSTLTSRANLAFWLGRAGHTDDAISAYRYLMEDRLRILGPDHPDTLSTRHNLAALLGQAGRTDDALDWFHQLLADRLRVLGPDHPDTLMTRNDLAGYLGRVGRAQEAITALEEVLEDRLRVLGPDHPDTMITRAKLGYWLGSSNRTDEAIAVHRRLLDDRLRTLGPDHPNTLSTRHNLAFLLIRNGRIDGVTAFRELLEDQLRVFGSDHLDTLNTRHNLGTWLGECGEIDEAINVFQQLLDDRIRIQGRDHPDTKAATEHLAYWRGRADHEISPRDP
jgi:tetratricopeptide (TPR) repeat protein